MPITDQNTMAAIQNAYSAGNWREAYRLVYGAISQTVIDTSGANPYDEPRPDLGVTDAV